MIWPCVCPAIGDEGERGQEDAEEVVGLIRRNNDVILLSYKAV
jgi:hypothetical protein